MSAQLEAWPDGVLDTCGRTATDTWNRPGCGAAFSLCRTWRYALWRIWDVTKRPLLVVGLNPSTASELADDPTITRCCIRAHTLGHGGLLMGNLFAYRATDPQKMKKAADPVGPKTNGWLIRMADDAALILCAWGAHGRYRNRDLEVRRRLDDAGKRPLWCLGQTKGGQPRHPLYLSYATPLEPY